MYGDFTENADGAVYIVLFSCLYNEHADAVRAIYI